MTKKPYMKLKRPTGPLIIRNAYNTIRTPIRIEGESRTQAIKGNETDVNAIMERFTRTGVMPPITTEQQYADVTDLQNDLQEILQKGEEAKVKWQELNNEAKKREKELKQQQQKQQENAQKADQEQLEQTT